VTLALTSASDPSPLWFTTRGAAVATLLLLTATVVLGIATSLRAEGRRTPRFVVAALHRNLSLFALLLLLVHIVTSVLDPFAGIRVSDVLIPFTGAYRTFWLGLGVLAAEILLVLVATSLLRGHVGPRWWRVIHWLAYASWPLALVHGLGTGSDAQQPWMLGLSAACMAAVLVALAARMRTGTWTTLPVRGLAAAVAVAATVAICGWAVAGPLQAGWAARAGTPASMGTATSTPPARDGPLRDPLVGILVRTSSGQVEISLRDTVDPGLTLLIMPPGPSQSLPVVTVDRGAATLCRVPARPTTTFYAVCGSTRLVITLNGSPPNIAGTLTASGPLR
jgi:sulfoxide reductase heme-binding subunit YedZ